MCDAAFNINFFPEKKERKIEKHCFKPPRNNVLNNREMNGYFTFLAKN